MLFYKYINRTWYKVKINSIGSCESFIKTEHASSTATHTHTRRTTVDSHIPSTSPSETLHTKKWLSPEASSLRDTIVHLTHTLDSLHTGWQHSQTHILKPSPSPHSQGVKHLSSSTCTYQSCVSPQPLSTLALSPLPTAEVLAFSFQVTRALSLHFFW